MTSRNLSKKKSWDPTYPCIVRQAKEKWNAILPRTFNADPLAQFIGTDTITVALIDDVPTKVLLDMGATIDLMPISYAKAAGLWKVPKCCYLKCNVKLIIQVACIINVSTNCLKSMKLRFVLCVLCRCSLYFRERSLSLSSMLFKVNLVVNNIVLIIV